MAKKTINIGSGENAGNGDPLRTAFSKINDNFSELYASLEDPQNGGAANTGVVPTSSKGVLGDKIGMIAADSNYIYVCKADYTDGLADIWSRNPLASGTW